ncbi:MAG: membrane integrity-associated transporter subunit PqiC [Ideonella sp.]|nr:membrane integrity-associated transporter subunit PqiC [Ideonella sp.]
MTRSRVADRLRECLARIAAGMLVGATLGLAACGTTPPTRFHSLLPAADAPSAATAVAPSDVRWEVLPVQLPAQVNQPQWLVRFGDDRLVVLEYDRWVAPLADEIRAAVSQRIVASLAARPSRGDAAVASGRPWRITIDVERFESVLGRVARIEAAWSIRSADAGQKALSCRSVLEQPVGAGLPALAAGHRVVVARLGDSLAAALAALAGGTVTGCGGPGG